MSPECGTGPHIGLRQSIFIEGLYYFHGLF